MTAPPCNFNKAVYHERRVLERVKKVQSKKAGCRLYDYWCNDCKGWHITKMPQDLIEQPKPEAKPVGKAYPPGHWNRMRMSEAQKLAEVERSNRAKKQLNRVDERWRRWRGCILLSSKEHAILKAIDSPDRLKDKIVETRRALLSLRSECAALWSMLRCIDGAWQQRGRYVKADVIEETLREWREAR